MDNVAFSLFWFEVYWYGIFYMIAFLIVYFFLYYLGKIGLYKKYPKLDNLLKNDVDLIIIYCILWVIIWGRLWYVLIYDLWYYLANPLKILYVWEWWMAFIGWMIWVLLSMLLLKKNQKLSNDELWLLFDSLVVLLPFGIALGRFGNYLNQEIYWIPVRDDFLNTDLWQFVQQINLLHVYEKVDKQLRWNTNFISIILEWIILGCITLFAGIRRIILKKYKPWFIVWLFLVFYSFFRFFIEYLRVDSQSEFLLFLTRSQWFFVGFFVVGIYLLFRKRG